MTTTPQPEQRKALGRRPPGRRAEGLRPLFGSRAGRPRKLLEHNWSTEPWTRGCYAGYMPPGVWTDFGAALRTPVGRLHWAGSETSEVFMGYMDGAVRSGETAAQAVLEQLG